MNGGMVKYALDLIQGEIEEGHTVAMLVPGHFTCFHRDRTKVVRSRWNGKECCRIINSLPVTQGKGLQDVSVLTKRGNKEVYTKFLKRLKPDIIHIHSFMGLHKAFLEAASKFRIPIVYTTHDYYGICPKAILLRGVKQCTVTDGTHCHKCIDICCSAKKLRWQQSLLYEVLKNNRLFQYLEYSSRFVPIKTCIRSLRERGRTKRTIQQDNIYYLYQKTEYQESRCYYEEMFGYVTLFHFNSNQSKEVFTRYLGNISGDIISISDRNVADRRRKKDFAKILHIGFIGRGAYKGFYILKEVLDSLYQRGMQDIMCHVYFNPKEKLPPYFISHQPYKDEDVEQVYSNIDVLILPSLWKETYGLVVLEALSYGVPVIVSQNVGAKELLERENGIGLIVQAEKEALRKVLENIYHKRELLSEMNLKICNAELPLKYEEHVHRVLDLYHKTIYTDQMYGLKKQKTMSALKSDIGSAGGKRDVCRHHHSDL